MTFGPLLHRPAIGIRSLSLYDVWHLLARWLQRTRQRADLAELDDYLLRDIGKTREEIRHECVKPFWR